MPQVGLDAALTARDYSSITLNIICRWKEVFEGRSRIFYCYINGFITELPEVCSVVFDRLVNVNYNENGDSVVKRVLKIQP
jgi:hypothetical protein